jgi:hypothetical protein
LLEQLSGDSPAPSESPILIDLTIGDLARLFGKRPSTVRSWVERGDFAGAYKLHGKEWRIPMSAVEEFQNRQRRSKSAPGLSAWRAVKRPNAPTRSEDGQDPATKRSPPGNAEA